MYFEYGEKEINYLKNKDKKLAEAIEKIGKIERPIDIDIFKAIIRAILGQQVSRKSRETVFKRMEDKLADINANTINNASVEELQSFGTTFKKCEYMKEFANKVISKELDLENLNSLTDKEIVNKLCELNGIGLWTAEMLLCSTLQRPDILSYGDIAIHRGMRMLYRHKKITKKMFERYKKRYSPFGTVASVYLWAISAGALPELDDPKDKKKINNTSKSSVDYF